MVFKITLGTQYLGNVYLLIILEVMMLYSIKFINQDDVFLVL